MMFYLITVLLGTLYPIFTDAISNNKISVGPPFYNSVIIPVVIVFLFFMAIGPKAKWIKNRFDNLGHFGLFLFLSHLLRASWVGMFCITDLGWPYLGASFILTAPSRHY